MTNQLKNILTFVLGFYFAGFFVNAASAQSSAAAELLKNKELSRRSGSTMDNPYELIENWPTLLPGQEWGAAIGLIPDDTGGLWMMFRSEPPINYINADGEITRSFGDGMIVQAHGFCMDDDGNLWAGDSGPFGDDPSTAGRGFQIHKFSQDGESYSKDFELGIDTGTENLDEFAGVGKQKTSKSKVNLPESLDDDFADGGLAGLLGE